VDVTNSPSPALYAGEKVGASGLSNVWEREDNGYIWPFRRPKLALPWGQITD
jgi:hypothetical protein